MGREAPARRLPGRVGVGELIALVLALDDRAALSERDRRLRDREIGVAMEPGEDMVVLRRWLREAPDGALRDRWARIESALRMLVWLWLGGGLFLGWAAAAALLSIEIHAGRVNIVLCVALLVLLPLVLLLFAWIAGLRTLGPIEADRPAILGGLQQLGIGRLALRLLTPSVRSDVEVVLGRLSAHRRLYARVQRIQLLVWSQLLGIGVALGALAATLGFVVFTDLAFGWSTTLQVEAGDVHPWILRFSAPWSGIWPEAVPSFELVQATRHFRAAVDDAPLHFIDPILYGGWWPFLVMALVGYNLVPRLVTWGAFRHWRAVEAGRALLRTPGAEALLDRLRTPIVDLQAEEQEGETGEAFGGLVERVDLVPWLAARCGPASRPTLVRWAEVATESAWIEGLAQPELRIREAGGRCPLEADARVPAACAEDEGAVLLGVRGYEPPVLDVIDFVAALRAGLGPTRALCVILVGGSEADREGWRRKLATLGDPGLVVGCLEADDV